MCKLHTNSKHTVERNIENLRKESRDLHTLEISITRYHHFFKMSCRTRGGPKDPFPHWPNVRELEIKHYTTSYIGQGRSNREFEKYFELKENKSIIVSSTSTREITWGGGCITKNGYIWSWVLLEDCETYRHTNHQAGQPELRGHWLKLISRWSFWRETPTLLSGF